ncbi:WD-40 repeat protein, partial [Spraguea lophii 42_110]
NVLENGNNIYTNNESTPILSVDILIYNNECIYIIYSTTKYIKIIKYNTNNMGGINDIKNTEDTDNENNINSIRNTDNKSTINDTNIIEMKYIYAIDSIIVNNNIMIIVGDIEGRIHIINNNKIIKTIHAHTDVVKDIKILKINEDRRENMNNDKDISYNDRDVSYMKNIYIITASQDRSIKIHSLYDYTLVSTLISHSDWINSINMYKNDIISSSSDNTIIYWKYRDNGWEIKERYGGLQEKNRAFYNAFVMEDGDDVKLLGQSHTGGFYCYNIKYKDGGENCLGYFYSGHTAEITSLDFYKQQDNYDNDDNYNSDNDIKDIQNNNDIQNNGNDMKNMLISGSLDFTVRIFDIKNNMEVLRPMCHGYPINDCKIIKNSNKIIIGSEESILRIMEPAEICYKIIQDTKIDNICYKIIQDEKIDDNKCYEIIQDKIDNHEFTAATTSELSLTNEILSLSINTKNFINEKSLSDYLLFSEYKKLYGHYFETECIATGNNFILSTNKSSIKKYSGIFLWYNNNNEDYELVQYIAVHDLTVTKIRITENNKYVIAVSRDRTASLYSIEEDNNNDGNNNNLDSNSNNHRSDNNNKNVNSNSNNNDNIINRIIKKNKYYLKFIERISDHKRLINDCYINDRYLITCSRDKRVLIYSYNNNNIDNNNNNDRHIDNNDIDSNNNNNIGSNNIIDIKLLKEIKIEYEVTAISVIYNILLIGDVYGYIHLYNIDNILDIKFISKYKIHSKINVIEVNEKERIIATGGGDNMVRVFKI